MATLFVYFNRYQAQPWANSFKSVNMRSGFVGDVFIINCILIILKPFYLIRYPIGEREMRIRKHVGNFVVGEGKLMDYFEKA